MKKYIICIFSILLILLVSCASGKKEKKKHEFPNLELGAVPKIRFILNNPKQDLYEKAYASALHEEILQYKNIEILILDSDAKTAVQQRAMEDYIQQKVSLIVIWPSNIEALIPTFSKVWAAKIPLVIAHNIQFDKAREFISAYVGPNYENRGRQAAQIMNMAIGGRGEIVQLTGLDTDINKNDLQNGFQKELAIIAPALELLETQAADKDAKITQDKITGMIKKYPRLAGVYVANDTLAISVIKAIQDNLFKKLIVISSSNNILGYDAIAEGNMYASVYISPKDEARAGLELALKILRGKKIKLYNYFDTHIITNKNYKTFTRPEY